MTQKIDAFAKLADGLFKLLAAVLIAVTTWSVGQYDSRLSATSLLSQREQAEMSLRASMLSDLIQQLIGNGNGDVDPKRERILVELLALNFHDHFEFKPLLIAVAEQTAPEDTPSLHALGRRVTDRQISMLSAEGRTMDEEVVIHRLYFDEASSDDALRSELGDDPLSTEFGCSQKTGDIQASDFRAADLPDDTVDHPVMSNSIDNPAKFSGWFVQGICTLSPGDGEVMLVIRIRSLNRIKMHATVSVDVHFEDPLKESLSNEFQISAYDFPLTDNWLLDPRHRFSLSLYEGGEPASGGNDGLIIPGRPAQIKLVWFPPGYITARERPINYQQIRKYLSVGSGKVEKL